MSVPAHHATTRHLGAAYPFASAEGLGDEGTLIGHDVFGGTFSYDPFELYSRGVLTNPNMLVFGQIGRGKSAFVKSFLWRQAVFGRRAWVVDPKGEYGRLAQALGTVPICLRPGGNVRINPLDTPPSSSDASPAFDGGQAHGLETSARGEARSVLGESRSAAGAEIVRQRAELLAALGEASLGRSLLPEERAALDLAVSAASTDTGSGEAKGNTGRARRRAARCPAPTLPDVVEAMLDPSASSARLVHTDVAGLAADGRKLALELRRLVAGDLRGMFDGLTTPGIDLEGRLVVLDLSAVYRSAALGILMTCATAWLQASLAARGAGQVIVVVDEAWAILGNLAVARWLQSSWKLSRAYGVANLAVLHRLSDLGASGPSGSEQAGLARGLLADSETRVVYAQSPGELGGARSSLGLGSTEAALLAGLGRGMALWQVGRRSFVVQHVLAPAERGICYTDEQMIGSP